jgi:hypothetical protein
MKSVPVLIVGIGFLILSFAWALVQVKVGSSSRRDSLSYTALLGASVALAGLLCISGRLERLVSINSYVHVLDTMSGVLLATTVCGIMVLTRNLSWLSNFLCFLAGATVTFMEFLGR